MKEERIWYRGTGTPSMEKPPHYEELEDFDHPRHYRADPPLRDAVNVAIALGIPLLLTGDPGTGKTQLASAVAYELGAGRPLVFSAKTTSTAQDLFYRYDALRHFRDSRFGEGGDLPVMRYVTFEALGLATLLAMPSEESDPYLPDQYRKQESGPRPRRSVVLIDEIDKAPRDLPNDILREIETMSFTVKEAGLTFPLDGKGDPRYRPIVIITSNSEKNLPDAFLRRCAYYNIEFPGETRLKEIVTGRFPGSAWLNPDRITAAIAAFLKVRKLPLKKHPATAEFLAWLRILEKEQIDPVTIGAGSREAIAFTAAILTKNKEDAEQVPKAF
jgi:MoxR-like ATPase